MARTQVNYGQNNPDALVPNQRRLNDPGLRPAANPVESFVNPVNTLDRNAGAKAQQLAQALSGLAPGLMSFAVNAQQRQNERMTQEGQNAAAEAARQGMTYKEAVDKGLIKRVDNPFFMAGAKEQFGRLAADQMANDLKLVLSEQLKDESDPQKVEAALQEAQKTWMAGNLGDNSGDRNFQTGFSLRASVHMEETRAALLQQAQTNLLQRSDAAIFSEASNAIKDSIGKGLTYEDIAGDLNFLKESMVAQGRSKDAVDKAMLKAIGEYMLTPDAQDVTKLFDLVTATSGLSLRDSQGEKSAEYVRSVVKAHTDLWLNKQRTDREIQRLRDQDVADGAAEQTITRLMENPAADIRDIVESVRGTPGAVQAVLTAVDQARKTNAIEDPEVAERLFVDIFNGKLGKADILSKINTEGLSLKTASQAISWIRSRDAEDRAEARANRSEAQQNRLLGEQKRKEYLNTINDPLLKRQISSLRSQFKDNAGSWVTKDAAQRADWAQAALQKAFYEWKNTPDGVTADATETVEWLFKTAQSLAGPLNAVVGSKYSGEKAPVPTSLPGGMLGSSSNSTDSSLSVNAPLVDLSSLTKAITTNRASYDIIDAMRKVGRDVTNPAEIAKFIREQRALYNK